ncbi:MAG TPA: hypothetical protein C5S50_10910 [Methanosarcinaceae archaeon]|nr:hypothetical protein [Methanosarcinaceae archaeon]
MKKTFSNLNLLSIVFLIVLLCTAAQPAMAAPTISIEPSHSDVLQGDLVTVNIIIDPQGVEIMGAQYYLYFNNTLLNATEQVEGYFLSYDGASTLVMPNRFNNTIGIVEYGEARIGIAYGVNAYGVLASVTFRALEPGVCNLDLGEVILSDPNANEISGVVVNSATLGISETHFTISGGVDYDNEDTVLDPDVIVTNLNTTEVFTSATNSSSNCYLISTNFAHISSGDVLHFTASDSVGNSTEFDRTVTQGEMDAGGFVQNITLYIPDTTPPIIANTTTTAITKDSATITWDTDELSDGQVKYGTSPGSYSHMVYSTAGTMHHSIDLTGLSLDTTYYYVVSNTDPSGNLAQGIEHDFKTFPQITVHIGDAVAMTGQNTTTSIMITNITNVGTVDIILSYNPAVVQVIAVNNGDFDFLGTDTDNIAGRTRIGAFQASSGGLNGTVRIANVTLGAVGSGGDTSALGLTINEIKEANWEEMSIPASIHNGTFTVWETAPPMVTIPTADPPSIPEDTDLDPKWGETTQLNITVTDECGVANVTINLTSIGGLPDQPMTHIPGTDIWTVTVSAPVGTAIISTPPEVPDTTAPSISNVNASDITNNSASITWDTDEFSDSLVRYGTVAGNYTLSANASSLVLDHTLALTSLLDNTTYYYVVNSTDSSGNSARSTEYNFATLETPDTTAPSISNVNASDVTNSSASITWNTDEFSDSLVRYGTVAGNYTLSANASSLVLDHTLALTSLLDNTTYHYVVNSTDSSGNSARSNEYNFTTNAWEK